LELGLLPGKRFADVRLIELVFTRLVPGIGTKKWMIGVMDAD
jgi:hypothetical protein